MDLCRHATVGSLVGRDRESRDEIMKRGLITEGEWELMVDQNIKVGMSECALLAATYGYGSPFRGVEGVYRFGADTNTLVLDAYDPRVPPASYTDHMKSRAREICYTPYACYTPTIAPTQQKYVPKYLITLKKGKVADCKSVDLAKVGTTADNGELFTLPCMKDVPGFKK